MYVHRPAVTPFINAASKNDLEKVKEMILQRGFDSQTLNSALLCACLKGYLPIVKFLISHGAEIDYNNPDTDTDLDTDWTALHRAAFSGNLELVQYLTEKGAKIDVTDKNNQIPLDIAAKYQNKQVQWAHPSKDQPLPSAIGYREIVQYLMQKLNVIFLEAANRQDFKRQSIYVSATISLLTHYHNISGKVFIQTEYYKRFSSNALPEFLL